MHEESASTVLSPRAMLVRFAVLIGAALLVGIGGASTVLEVHQATACAVSSPSFSARSFSGDSGSPSPFSDWRC